MTRVWHRYEQWECLAMYQPNTTVDADTAKQRYATFLASPNQFAAAIERVFAEWPIACEHFLTDESMNRIAWIGQASAALALGIPRHYRAGFMLLSDAEQRQANRIAATALHRWERTHAQQNRTLSASVVQTRLWE